MDEFHWPWQRLEQDELPEWFVHPEPRTLQQRCLFRSKLSFVIAGLRISPDEMAVWHANGWLSFDGTGGPELDDLDDPRFWELVVVRDVVRSGLSAAQIDCLLSQLPKPFAIPPHRLAFSFRYGWVEAAEPKEPDPNKVIPEHLDTWLESQDPEQLHEVRQKIDGILDTQ